MSAVTRRIATTTAALALGLGLVSFTTPAHAVIDTSWGQAKAPAPTR